MSNELVRVLLQLTAMGLIVTLTESVSSASGGTGTPSGPVPTTVTMSVKLVQSVTRGMMQENDAPGSRKVGNLHPEIFSLLVTTIFETGTWLGVPSMQTAWIVILKQKAEQSVLFSFLMPQAVIWSFSAAVNGSHAVSGLTQTTSSVIRMQGIQVTRKLQRAVSLTVWAGLQLLAPVAATVFSRGPLLIGQSASDVVTELVK
jgi:hypothetical protein